MERKKVSTKDYLTLILGGPDQAKALIVNAVAEEIRLGIVTVSRVQKDIRPNADWPSWDEILRDPQKLTGQAFCCMNDAAACSDLGKRRHITLIEEKVEAHIKKCTVTELLAILAEFDAEWRQIQMIDGTGDKSGSPSAHKPANEVALNSLNARGDAKIHIFTNIIMRLAQM